MICYNDGTAKLYLYTGGELGGTKELKALLRFFRDSQEHNAIDEDLKKLLEIVNRIKGDEKVGEQYMLFKSNLDYEREDARAEGHAEGHAEGFAAGCAEGRAEGIIVTMRKFNATEEQIIAALVEECNLSEEEAREKLAGNQ